MKKILLTGIILSVLIAPSFASAITLDELQAQLAVLLQQIKLLQSQLPETQDEDDVIQPTCHTSNLWSWDYATQSCKGNVGEGDCDRDADCNTGYCAKDIGKKYGQVSTMDVCENKSSTTTQPSITVTAPNGGERWQLGNTHTILWTPYENTPTLINSSSQVTAYLEKVVNGKYVNIGKIVACGKASIHWEGSLDKCNSGNVAQPGNGYYIRLVNNQTGAQDRSDRPFTLIRKDYLNADLKVNNSDNAITIPEGGGTYNVSWTSNAESCRIATSLNGIFEPISGLSSSGNRSIRLNPNSSSYDQALSLYCTSKNEIEGSAYDQVAITANSANDFIQIISPNGGESINLNDKVFINWAGATKGGNMEKVSIALYKNDKSFKWIVTDMPTSGGNYFYYWYPSETIFSNEVANNVFKIYIIGYKTGGGSVTDISDRPFSIVAPTPQPSITVTSPNGGEQWEVGKRYRIKWQPFISSGTDVWVYLNGGGHEEGYSKVIGSPIGNAYLDYTVTASDLPVNPGNTWKVIVCDGKMALDVANCGLSGTFSIVAPVSQPSITVISPNGGEKWEADSIQRIVFDTKNVNGVDIQLERWADDNGQIFAGGPDTQIIVNNISVVGYGYSWTIPANIRPSNYYKIRVVKSGDTSSYSQQIADNSDNYFSILYRATCISCDDDIITVTAPNGGESINLNDKVFINWAGATKGGNMEKVSIALYKNDKSFKWIVTDMPTSGGNYFYYWYPSETIFSNEVANNVFKIYIIGYKTGGGSVTDISDRPFSIVAPTPQPSITVTSPNGGEKWQLGSTHSILWSPYNYNPNVNPSGEVVAYLDKLVNGNYISMGQVKDCGKASIHWEGNLDTCNSGTYPAPGDYYIRVVNNQTGKWDRSDRPFTLIRKDYLNADLKVNNSDGPVTIPAGGGAYNVSWTSNAEKCSLYNGTLGKGDVDQQINNLPPSGSRFIQLATPSNGNTDAYINLVCASTQSIEGGAYDEVRIDWASIPQPSITVTSPNGGEKWEVGKTYEIRWNAKDYPSEAVMGAVLNDQATGYNIRTIIENYCGGNNSPCVNPGDGFYKWTIPTSIPVGTYKMRLICMTKNSERACTPDGTTTTDPNVHDTSDAPFSIVPPTPQPSITVKSVIPHSMSACQSSSYCQGPIASIVDANASKRWWYPAAWKANALIEYANEITGNYEIGYKWVGDGYDPNCGGDIYVSQDKINWTKIVSNVGAKEMQTYKGNVPFKYLKTDFPSPDYVSSHYGKGRCGWVGIQEINVKKHQELGLNRARMQVASASSALGLGVGDTKMRLSTISSALKKLMEDIKGLLK